MQASSSGTRCACMLQPLILAKANLSCFESCPSCRGVCHDTVPQAYRKAHPRRSAGRGSQCTCAIVGKDAGWHNGHQGSNAKRCAVVAGTHGRHAKAFPSRLAQHELKAQPHKQLGLEHQVRASSTCYQADPRALCVNVSVRASAFICSCYKPARACFMHKNRNRWACLS